MQDNHLFEYAVIRVVPKVEREEFLNVGVILYCKSQKYLGVKFELNPQRLAAFKLDVDIEDLYEHLNSFKLICEGGKEGGPIAQFDLPSRFRWLTATRSTMVQTSKVHPGFAKSAEQTLNKLFDNLVA